ncbi:MAG: thiamine-phosphate kinase [Acidimicrobiales bacterium]
MERSWEEELLIADLRQTAHRDGQKDPYVVELGDDAAVYPTPWAHGVACADQLVEGVHFDLAYLSLSDVGFKAVTVNLSDLAAMGAQPDRILCTIAAPKTVAVAELIDGVRQACRRFDVELVGGDLSRGSEIVVSVSAIGHLGDHELPLRRDRGRPGDAIAVTRALGAAAAGLRSLRANGSHHYPRLPHEEQHARPLPRIEEGRAALIGGASGAMDISDGFALDLHRLADLSDVGFVIDHVPVDPAATEEEALFGGEDYELIITTPHPNQLERTFRERGLPPPLVIGRIVADRAVRTHASLPLPRRGYLH